jgi:hypothetical protein
VSNAAIPVPLVVQATAADMTPLVAKGTSGQTADLQQWQDNSGFVRARIKNDGGVGTDYVQAGNWSPRINLTNAGVQVDGVDPADPVLKVAGPASGGQTGNLQEWKSGSLGTVLSAVKPTGAIEVPPSPYSSAWDANLEVPTKNDVYDKIQSLADPRTFPYCHATRSGDQSIPSGGAMVVWNNAVTDSHAGLNTGTGTYTIPENGLYALSWELRWNANTTGVYRQGSVEIGAVSHALQKMSPLSGGAHIISGSVTIRVTAGTLLKVQAAHDATAAINIQASHCYMIIAKVADIPATTKDLPKDRLEAEPR